MFGKMSKDNKIYQIEKKTQTIQFNSIQFNFICIASITIVSRHFTETQRRLEGGRDRVVKGN